MYIQKHVPIYLLFKNFRSKKISKIFFLLILYLKYLSHHHPKKKHLPLILSHCNYFYAAFFNKIIEYYYMYIIYRIIDALRCEELTFLFVYRSDLRSDICKIRTCLFHFSLLRLIHFFRRFSIASDRMTEKDTANIYRRFRRERLVFCVLYSFLFNGKS